MITQLPKTSKCKLLVVPWSLGANIQLPVLKSKIWLYALSYHEKVSLSLKLKYSMNEKEGKILFFYS